MKRPYNKPTKTCLICANENDLYPKSSYCKKCKNQKAKDKYHNPNQYKFSDFKRFKKTNYYVSKGGDVLHIWYSHRDKKIFEKKLKGNIKRDGQKRINLSIKGVVTTHYITKLIREVWD